MFFRKLKFTIIIFAPVVCMAYAVEEEVNPCSALLNCAACIQNPACAWCSQTDFHGKNKKQLPRCNTHLAHSELGGFKCASDKLFTPKNVLIFIRNESLSDNRGGRGKHVPVQPQELSLELRVGESVSFDMKYKVVEDYPLDLYYLMDGTYTMKDDKQTLIRLGDSIAERLRSLTSKFRQGFGTFVDKTTMPFVSTIPKLLENPCDPINDFCIRPYSFQNHMKLSNYTEQFKEAVNNFVLSASSDSPEGGFDALMQVMVCQNEIGWSEQARRLVIFATDAPFHYAGDGRLGGVILPNDGECHMDSLGEYYTHSLIYDYPSISQISTKVQENSINLIFAVTSNSIKDYQSIKPVIEGSQITELARDSSNIVKLVEEQYKNITSKVEIKDTFPSEYFQVSYFTRCMSYTESEKSSCEDLHPGEVVQFRVEVELKKCPPKGLAWKQQYRIYAVGVPDGINLDVETLCDCPCRNQEENWIPNAPLCNYNGYEVCGLCECNDNFEGKNCECSYSGTSSRVNDPNECKLGNSTEICSGRGTCNCGQCDCGGSERYSGAYCECDNHGCHFANNQLCGGHGTCECGKCQCDSGWEGDGCDCSTTRATCMPPGEETICNGKGTCVCGRCQCGGLYSGDYCEKCLHESCPKKCEELKHCVQCRTHATGIHNPADCDLNCYTQKINIVDVVSVAPGSEEVLCKEEDQSDECIFIFSYRTLRDKTNRIKSQRAKECPPKAPIFWIIVIVASIVVLAGLILLCAFRSYRNMQVKREYVAYEKRIQNPDWKQEINPIYNNPVSTFNNPGYGKAS